MDAPRTVDKLAKVYLREDPSDWVILHFEFQAAYRKDFAHRMYSYFYRLMDKHNKEISAYAIFTEASDVQRPAQYVRSFLGTELSYRFHTFKVTEPTDEELYAHENPFAIAILAARIAGACRHIRNDLERDCAVLARKIELIKYLLSKGLPQETEFALLHFISFYVILEFSETQGIFDRELHLLTQNNDFMNIEDQIREITWDKGVAAGRREGREEGRLEGLVEGEQKGKLKGRDETLAELAGHLILTLGYTDEQAASALKVPVSFVKKFHQ
jgi:hypothetical protein